MIKSKFSKMLVAMFAITMLVSTALACGKPPAPTLSEITATYTQGATVVTPSTALDSLKSGLVVKARYSDNTETTLAGTVYTLSGTLTEGSSTITVTYEGKTATFSVTVSAATPSNVLQSISAVLSGENVPAGTTLETLKGYLTVTATYSVSGAVTLEADDYTLSGTLTDGQTSSITVAYSGQETTVSVAVRTSGMTLGDLPAVTANTLRVFFYNGYTEFDAVYINMWDGNNVPENVYAGDLTAYQGKLMTAVGDTGWYYMDVVLTAAPPQWGFNFQFYEVDELRINAYWDRNESVVTSGATTLFVYTDMTTSLTNSDRGFAAIAEAELAISDHDNGTVTVNPVEAGFLRVYIYNGYLNYATPSFNCWHGDGTLAIGNAQNKAMRATQDPDWFYIDVDMASTKGGFLNGLNIQPYDGADRANTEFNWWCEMPDLDFTDGDEIYFVFTAKAEGTTYFKTLTEAEAAIV